MFSRDARSYGADAARDSHRRAERTSIGKPALSGSSGDGVMRRPSAGWSVARRRLGSKHRSERARAISDARERRCNGSAAPEALGSGASAKRRGAATHQEDAEAAGAQAPTLAQYTVRPYSRFFRLRRK